MEFKLRVMWLRSERVLSKARKLRERLLNTSLEGACQKERSALLSDLDHLLADPPLDATGGLESGSLRESEQLSSQLKLLREQNEEISGMLGTLRTQADELRKDNEELQESNSRLGAELNALRVEHAAALAASQAGGGRCPAASPRISVDDLKLVTDIKANPSATGSEPCSEANLRAALASQGTTSLELNQAITSVESLIEEARQKLAIAELRAQPAHGDELVPEGMVRRRSSKEGLQRLSSQQQAARQTRQIDSQNRKRAFLLVNIDDAEGLQDLLKGLPDRQWQLWRDSAGRSLWRCAQEQHSRQAQQCLSVLLGLRAPRDMLLQPRLGRRHSAAEAVRSMPALPGAGAQVVGEGFRGSPSLDRSCSSTAPCPTAEEGSVQHGPEQLRLQAFRAVVRDDTSELSDVLSQVAIEVWSKWTNKAGHDLLSLSDERGSSKAKWSLAEALGLLSGLQCDLDRGLPERAWQDREVQPVQRRQTIALDGRDVG
eukprot:CAMPEP_0170632690 /NCGR_PEP_ID=MMETSP0224-20130122/35475_1 /TAXON_ID=285029 /ORGANISM="Togula jolla, Strain CCCM 725" /LENGTH=488 /DNA_ID=CAMNT_0010961445 /DNA_START=45 /DNA_END=1511 /DNA_ORIENTATION=+